MPNAPKNLSSEPKTRKRDKLQGSQKMYQLQKLESEYKEKTSATCAKQIFKEVKFSTGSKF